MSIALTILKEKVGELHDEIKDKINNIQEIYGKFDNLSSTFNDKQKLIEAMEKDVKGIGTEIEDYKRSIYMEEKKIEEIQEQIRKLEKETKKITEFLVAENL